MSIEAELTREIQQLKRRLERFETAEFAAGSSGTWVPTFGGFSADPANGMYRWVLNGKLCAATANMPNAGTSNATTFSITLPFTSSNPGTFSWYAAIVAIDNGVQQAAPGVIALVNNASTANLYTSWAGAGWTAAGNKRAHFTLIFEVA